MSKHTPGPWELGASDDYYVSADAYPKNFPHHFKSDDLGDYLAYVGNRTHDFGEANARLIAAAPDLLAACIDLTDQLALLANDPKKNPWVKQGREAIAKAEGTLIAEERGT